MPLFLLPIEHRHVCDALLSILLEFSIQFLIVSFWGHQKYSWNNESQCYLNSNCYPFLSRVSFEEKKQLYSVNAILLLSGMPLPLPVAVSLRVVLSAFYLEFTVSLFINFCSLSHLLPKIERKSLSSSSASNCCLLSQLSDFCWCTKNSW